MDKPGLVARTRQGYYAQPEEVSPQRTQGHRSGQEIRAYLTLHPALDYTDDCSYAVFVCSLRRFRGLTVLFLFVAMTAFGQDKPSSEQAPAQQAPAAKIPNGPAPPIPTIAKPPALVDPNGPAMTLQPATALRYCGRAHECGYDQDLENSDPLRQHIRDDVNQYLRGSAAARDALDKVCTYIAQHRLANSGRDLVQEFRWRCIRRLRQSWRRASS